MKKEKLTLCTFFRQQPDFIAAPLCFFATLHLS
jgi:hypothetical protein